MPVDIDSIRHKFESFMEQAKRNPLSVDDTPLMEACREVEEALSKKITPERVHLADDIYRYMGQEGLEKRLSLHRAYMDKAPNAEERFWSNWHLVDTLAVLRRNRETVEEQLRFYQWTVRKLTDEHVLRALEDTTQARCWRMEERIEEWLQLYTRTWSAWTGRE